MFSEIPAYTWATAATLVAALVLLRLRLRAEERQHARDRYAHAAQVYRDAVDSADPDRIHLAAERLHAARQEAERLGAA